MAQQHVWDSEYTDPKLVTKGQEPQSSVLRFLKSLRKQSVSLENSTVLDLGCGTGRNAIYCAQQGARVVGIEISTQALKTATQRAVELGLDIQFSHGSIGERYDVPDNSVDIILDVTSSNSLNEKERSIYLQECVRVLRPGGHMFVRALCKDGDTNAKKLLKDHPGKEYDTYIIPDFGLVERVFSKEDFENTYRRYFQIYFLKKETHYSVFDGVRYRRNYWIAYLQKS